MSDDATPQPQQTPEPVVIEAVPVDEESTAAGPGEPQASGETITEPAKLLRIASMVRELLDETRQASMDESGRARLADVYHRAVEALTEVLSPDLQEELGDLAPPLEGVPSESEIRVAQAQLVGWLEGLFHGIQTALFAQQMAARQQLEQMRQGALPPGVTGPPGQRGGHGTGQYL
jgi:hypothetical protein